MAGRQRLSLKGQALKYLAIREHSRIELRRKLLPHARVACSAPEGASPEDVDGAAEQVGPCLDKLLDWLEAHGLLSQERFIESRIRSRATRFGASRIRQELSLHGLAMPIEQRAELAHTEVERARQVWARKFSGPATDPAARAKQMRFLAARGFASDAIRQVVWGKSSDEPHEAVASSDPSDDTPVVARKRSRIGAFRDRGEPADDDPALGAPCDEEP